MERESGASSPKSPNSRFAFYRLLAFGGMMSILIGCSLFKTRPVQEMSNTAAAIKAAKEVQADVLAPVLYREANEWYQRAKIEYKFKNFEQAEEYAMKARKLAEDAEFEVIKNAGQRVESVSDTPPPAPAPEPSPTPYAYPSPTATPYDRAIQTPQAGEPNGGGAQTPTQIQVPPPPGQ